VLQQGISSLFKEDIVASAGGISRFNQRRESFRMRRRSGEACVHTFRPHQGGIASSSSRVRTACSYTSSHCSPPRSWR